MLSVYKFAKFGNNLSMLRGGNLLCSTKQWATFTMTRRKTQTVWKRQITYSFHCCVGLLAESTFGWIIPQRMFKGNISEIGCLKSSKHPKLFCRKQFSGFECTSGLGQKSLDFRGFSWFLKRFKKCASIALHQAANASPWCLSLMELRSTSTPSTWGHGTTGLNWSTGSPWGSKPSSCV